MAAFLSLPILAAGELLRLVAKVHIVRNNSENATDCWHAHSQRWPTGCWLSTRLPGYLDGMACMACMAGMSLECSYCQHHRLSFVFVKYAFNFLRCIFRLSANWQLAATAAPDCTSSKGRARISDSGTENAHITYTQCCGLLVFFGEQASTLQISRVTEPTYRGDELAEGFLWYVIIYSFHVPLAVKRRRAAINVYVCLST